MKLLMGLLLEHQAEGVSADIRYQGADLWSIRRDIGQSVKLPDIEGFVLPTVRVTIGAWKTWTAEGGIREELNFFPDILLMGRYVPPGDRSSIPAGEEQTLPIAEFNPWLPESIGRFRETVIQKLGAAWQQASAFALREKAR